MNFRERLNKLIEDKGVTPYEISAKTGVSQSALSRYISGDTDKPNLKNAILLAKYFNVDANWITTGKGSMLKDESPKNDLVTSQQLVIEKLSETINRQSKIIEALTLK